MFVSAGFFVTRSVLRPDYSDSSLLPDRIVSVSPCITKFLPDTWCLEWTGDTDTERYEAAEFFGLDEHELLTLISETTPAFDSQFGWPNVNWALDSARSLITLILHRMPDIRILELGLHDDFVNTFCRDAEPEQHEGYAPVGRQGIHEMILQRREISGSGTPIGFEPLLSDGMISCSWLCNGLESVVAERLHIRPNSNGLIDTFDDAAMAVSEIARDDVGAEPGLWIPWLIVEHNRKAEQLDAVEP